MREIPLTQGQVALVDDGDYEWLNQWKWQAVWSKITKSYYVKRTVILDGRRKHRKTLKVQMHRLIMGCTKGDGLIVDHRNHNTLDNQRYNLRVCTNSQNMMNRRGLTTTNTSGTTGVYYLKSHKKWAARIWGNYGPIFLGYYDTKEEAVAARRTAELHYFGEFAPESNV